MKIEVRTHSLAKTSWAHQALKIYSKKISHFCEFEFKVLKPEKSLLQNLDSKDKIILCDERGKNLSSREFSKKIETFRDSSVQRVVIIIGGPFGVDEDLRAKSDLIVSLSPMVMNQEVALIALFEQVFRAWTIIHNHPYHND
ncbi:MAG: 23S rRNA (pseudouridine(1915)-N(3))-methyltransferase RlmH [Bdellovibrionales bacterium]|nr:23S rRNA (pseudouridine(1915)-N(3))-methyltransferase RlmH [Bdellovibrionales bacterium]NQZ18618.1 23S rRNA (pseudouridine(1915)-N(3))-methyltransferase RlmH [Bdellovibrionales bacterium]